MFNIMIITSSQIKVLSDQLHEVIAKKEGILKSATAAFKSWNEIEFFIDNIKSVMIKTQAIISRETEELKNMKSKSRDLMLIREIDTTNKKSEKFLNSFVEIQSVVTNMALNSSNNLLEKIHSNMRKLQDFINHKLDHKKKHVIVRKHEVVDFGGRFENRRLTDKICGMENYSQRKNKENSIYNKYEDTKDVEIMIPTKNKINRMGSVSKMSKEKELLLKDIIDMKDRLDKDPYDYMNKADIKVNLEFERRNNPDLKETVCSTNLMILPNEKNSSETCKCNAK